MTKNKQNKKVVIIGGGVAGLTAGIYALQGGMDTVIYEKNTLAGGECTGWDRQGYHIDNCIHWLTGCCQTDSLYEIWNNIGAIDKDTEIYREKYFYSFELDGICLHLWGDVEKTRKEFLQIAPEDSKEINKFFDAVKYAESSYLPIEKSFADMGLFDYIKLGKSMAPMLKVIKEYGKCTMTDLVNRFHNKYIRAILGGYYDGAYSATILIYS